MRLNPVFVKAKAALNKNKGLLARKLDLNLRNKLLNLLKFEHC